MDWVFIDMFEIRMQKAKIEIPAISEIRLSAIPIKTNAVERKTKEATSGYRLSKRETSQPEIGKPISEPTGIVSKRLPNWASFKSKADFMVGILDAQVEKKNPERKK